MAANKRVAVVTGANRGLGLETARQMAEKGFKVILTSRSEEDGKKATQELKNTGLDVYFHELDVGNSQSTAKLAKYVEQNFGRLDILVNNAGVSADKMSASIFDVDLDAVRRTLDTNTYGPIRVAQALIPIMRKNKWGRVVNVSSGMGQLKDMGSGHPAYRISKTALNAVTRLMANELQSEGIKVNSACPGWVRTDMGGPHAPKSIPEGADTIVFAATLPDDGPTGNFLKERKVIPW